jgi:hypothetical protein
MTATGLDGPLIAVGSCHALHAPIPETGSGGVEARTTARLGAVQCSCATFSAVACSCAPRPRDPDQGRVNPVRGSAETGSTRKPRKHWPTRVSADHVSLDAARLNGETSTGPVFAGIYGSSGTRLVRLAAVQCGSEPLPAVRSSRNPPPKMVREPRAMTTVEGGASQDHASASASSAGPGPRETDAKCVVGSTR